MNALTGHSFRFDPIKFSKEPKKFRLGDCLAIKSRQTFKCSQNIKQKNLSQQNEIKNNSIDDVYRSGVEP